MLALVHGRAVAESLVIAGDAKAGRATR